MGRFLPPARWEVARAGAAPRDAASTASFCAMHVAHLGVALLVAGASLSGGLGQSADVAVAPGATGSAGFLRIRAEGASRADGPSYRAVRLRVAVLEEGRETLLEPELRYYRPGGLPIAKPATQRGFARDLHVALAVPASGTAWVLQVRVRPFMSLVWAGMGLVAAGGLLALAGRLLRSRSPEHGCRAGSVPDLALGGST